MNWDKDGNGDGNEDGIREGGGETNERKEPHKTYRRDHPFSSSTRHHLCRQGVVPARTRQLRSQGTASVHAHRTKGVIGCVGREDANGVRSGIRVGGGNEDGNGVEVRTYTLMSKGTERERIRGGGQRRNPRCERGRKTRDRIGESGGEANMRKETHKVCGHTVKTGETWAEGENSKHESIDSVAVNHDQIENSREAGSETQGTKGLRMNCRCRGSVSSLSRLIKSFPNKYY